MELSRYARFFRRNALLIVVVALVTALFAGLLAAGQKPTYRATNALLLALRDPRTPTTYDYDQFYVLQAQELYSVNIVAWLNSEDISQTLSQQAQSPNGRVRGKKNGGTIELTAMAPTENEANTLIAVANKLITDRARTLAQGANRATFDVVPGGTATRSVPVSPVRSGVLGLVAGLLAALALAVVREAFRRGVRDIADLQPFTRWTVVSGGSIDEKAMAGYRELREELAVEKGTVVVCDVTGRLGTVATNLARAFAEASIGVALIHAHGEAEMTPLGHQRGVDVVETKEGGIPASRAKSLLNKQKAAVVIVSAGPAHADLLAWQRHADVTVVAVERDRTAARDLAFLQRELPADVRVAYLT